MKARYSSHVMIHLLDCNTAASIAARSFVNCSIVARVTSKDTAPDAPDGCFVFRLKSTLWGQVSANFGEHEHVSSMTVVFPMMESKAARPLNQLTGSILEDSCLAAV
jgi:hypothetical protein